jgi:ATP-dependent DNA helicase RecG
MGGVDVRFSPKVMQEMLGETTQKSTVKITLKSTVKTLELIKENPLITIPELAISLNKSKSAIEKQIAKLKENQQLERIGPDNGGYWQVKK